MGLAKDLNKIFFTGTAVYISMDFVDIASANISFKGYGELKINRFRIAPQPGEALYENPDSGLAGAVKKAFPEEDNAPFRVATNLRNESFILRRFTLKDIPEAEVRQASVFESQKYLPYPIEELTYELSISRKRKDLQEIIFSGVRTKAINGIVEFFKARKILPSIIEPVPELIVRSLISSKQINESNAYISVHFEPVNRIILTEIYGMRAQSFREIALSYPESTGTERLSYAKIEEIWPLLENDIIGSAAFLRKETKKELAKIFISGFDRSNKESVISAEFGVAFERPDLSYFKGTSSIENPDRFLPALRLLNDSVSSPSLNLAPKDVTLDDLWGLKKVVKRAAAALILIFMAHACFVGIISFRAGEAKKLYHEMGKFKYDPKSTVEDTSRIKALMEEKAIFINTILSRKIFLTDKMIQLTEDISSNAWIENIKFKNSIENQGPELAIGCSLFSAKNSSGPDPNNILNNIKRDPKMLAGFNAAELVSVTKRQLGEGELSEFQITLK